MRRMPIVFAMLLAAHVAMAQDSRGQGSAHSPTPTLTPIAFGLVIDCEPCSDDRSCIPAHTCSAGRCVPRSPTPTPPTHPTLGVTVDVVEGSLRCAASLEVVLRNVGSPGTVLEIRSVMLWNAYSQGFYGRGFTPDLSAVDLPVSLTRSDALRIPVVYSAAGQRFPSRLELEVEHSGPSIVDTHVGIAVGELECGDCFGDCDGDGQVRITELIRLVRAAHMLVCNIPEPDLCPYDPCLRIEDRNGDGTISLDELTIAVNRLVEAVGNALYGCPRGTPTPTPQGFASAHNDGVLLNGRSNQF